MPRFHFSTRDGEHVVDSEGVEMADAATAKREAIRFAGEWLRDDPETFARDRRHELTVTDQGGATMWVIMVELAHGPGDPRGEKNGSARD